MFKSLNDHWKKAEAAALIQTIFEESPELVDRKDAASLANGLVGKAWEGLHHMFDGRIGPRPNKATIAAVTLSYTLDNVPKEGRIYPVARLALAKLMSGLAANAFLLELAQVDKKLLSIAESALADHFPDFVGDELDDELSEMLARKG